MRITEERLDSELDKAAMEYQNYQSMLEKQINEGMKQTKENFQMRQTDAQD